jgi:hypothetical protein
MKKLFVVLTMLTLIGQTWAASDVVDNGLRKRETMVAAIAILLTVPPKCLLDNKRPSTAEFGLFMLSYGHANEITGQDAFFADVKIHMQKTDAEFTALSPSDKASFAEFICGYASLLSTKVRNAVRR